MLAHSHAIVLEQLRRDLAGAARVEVVGATTAAAAVLDLVQRLQPHVVCLDPKLEAAGGLRLTRTIMSSWPTPVLGFADPRQPDLSAQMLQDGALDVVASDVAASLLAAKIRVVAGVKVFARRPEPASIQPAPPASGAPPRLLAIGASTGGPKALQLVLSGLGPSFPLPILCVQHMSPGFLAGLIRWLDSSTAFKVKQAAPGERPAAGTVYFAPEEHHLSLDPSGALLLDDGPKVDGHRPSATVLFRAVARVAGNAAIGVLLTGMGEDGAEGMLELHRKGALTMAQDESTSVVFGMAGKAVELGAIRQVLALEEISAHLLAAVGRPRRK